MNKSTAFVSPTDGWLAVDLNFCGGFIFDPLPFLLMCTASEKVPEIDPETITAADDPGHGVSIDPDDSNVSCFRVAPFFFLSFSLGEIVSLLYEIK